MNSNPKAAIAFHLHCLSWKTIYLPFMLYVMWKKCKLQKMPRVQLGHVNPVFWNLFKVSHSCDGGTLWIGSAALQQNYFTEKKINPQFKIHSLTQSSHKQDIKKPLFAFVKFRIVRCCCACTWFMERKKMKTALKNVKEAFLI